MWVIDRTSMIILDTSVGQKELHTMFSNGYDINDLDG